MDSGGDRARKLGEISELVVNILGNHSIGWGHWNGEMPSPRQVMGRRLFCSELQGMPATKGTGGRSEKSRSSASEELKGGCSRFQLTSPKYCP